MISLKIDSEGKTAGPDCTSSLLSDQDIYSHRLMGGNIHKPIKFTILTEKLYL